MPDITISCAECKKDFKFSAQDQDKYTKLGFQPPKRCYPCREARKKAKDRGGPWR